jgi:hypothetical protein
LVLGNRLLAAKIGAVSVQRSTVVEPHGDLGPDLLDANETNWAFVSVDRMGVVGNQQVKRLAALAT